MAASETEKYDYAVGKKRKESDSRMARVPPRGSVDRLCAGWGKAIKWNCTVSFVVSRVAENVRIKKGGQGMSAMRRCKKKNIQYY